MRAETAELRERIRRKEAWLDWFATFTTFKTVLLEGFEVVLIGIALGSGGGMLVPATSGAVAACLLVAPAGPIVHRPLARVPENATQICCRYHAVGVRRVLDR
jgi:uncharacterized membrane protein